ncbi:MAG: CNP1-like family protein [Gammaproteobacteria bacterium]|nr:CNP1-like family protein [Gammaproteobacteria bacterium]
MHKPSFATGRGAAVVVIIFVIAWSMPLSADSYGDPFYEYRDEVERGEFSYDDSQDIPWIENETEVLALPREEDLVAVDMAQLPRGMQLLVDLRRITVNPDDRVVRLWLVVRSDGGIDNGTFEGFRCPTREYKIYAYANPHRTPPVRKAERPRWQLAKANRTGNYRRELLQDYFCSMRGSRDADEIRLALTGESQRDTFVIN